ncbi:MAG: hypothetical protein GX575_22825 [Candidatus Anammoximicrobium sp.]|nr:hypothetical protein [Candidatus Anammoximicrobium sp.]
MDADPGQRRPAQTLGRVGAAVALWLTFSVLVGLVPILLGYARMESRANKVTVADVIARGEMALVCVGLAAGPLGLLIGTGRKRVFLKIVAGGMSFFLAALSAGYSSDLSANELEKNLELSSFLQTLTDDRADVDARKKALGDLTRLMNNPHADKNVIMRNSLYLLCGTVISGAACVALSELDA